jgi:hypothetical protein
MSIVVIAIPGDAKRVFVNELFHASGGAVSLVIIQKVSGIASPKWGREFFRIHTLGRYFQELYSAIILRFSSRLRSMLTYFREWSATMPDTGEYPAPVLFVDSVNSDEVYEAIQAINPEIIAIWGSNIVSQRIISSAKNVVNFHQGYCPDYRGTWANQYAVYKKDFLKIGATIHKVSPRVDAGEVYAVVGPVLSLPPKELFRDLNNRARAVFIDIIVRLHAGERILSWKQDTKKGVNVLLKNWTPRVRYAVARRMRTWERKGLRFVRKA